VAADAPCLDVRDLEREWRDALIAKDEATVSITRGENSGKTLSYYHPVRELTPIGMWEGEAMTLRLPLKDLKTRGGDYLVALLQVENAGPILGAAQY